MVSFGARRSGKPAKKRMLIIVNPYATTVSDRLKNLVVYALQGRYDVEAVSTEAQHHATEIGREAREGGYDIVPSLGERDAERKADVAEADDSDFHATRVVRVRPVRQFVASTRNGFGTAGL